MSTFHTQKWEARFAKMGDEAEQTFEEVYPLNWVRNGLNRPPLKVSMLPERIRFQPDYLTSRGYVECKGVGRDQTLKIKIAEFSVMNYWHQLHPLELFIWDSYKKRWGTLAFTDLRDLIHSGAGVQGTYPEGNAYWALKLADIPTIQWTARDGGA